MLSLRKINFTFKVIPIFRTLGTNSDKLVVLDYDKEGIATLKLNRAPVNSLNLELFMQVLKNLDIVKNDKNCKGLVIASALPKIFSAGIDLNELHNPDRERLRQLWITLQDIFFKLYGSGMNSAAAINGHAAAGAFVISTLCDYRVMVNNGSRMGLNDTQVGIVPSKWVSETYKNIVGHKHAEIGITAAIMYKAEEAYKINLVDSLATDQEDAIAKCKSLLHRYDNISTDIIRSTKQMLRQDIIKYLRDHRDEDTEIFLNNIMNPVAQKQIEYFVQQLKQRKNKAQST